MTGTNSRKYVRSHLAVLAACAAFCACGCSNKPQAVEFLAMGTRVSVDVAQADASRAGPAIQEIESLARRLGNEWYPWTPDGHGELAQLNAGIARGDTVVVSQALASLLARTQEIMRASDGSFDPGVGKLVELWGFTTGDRPATLPAPTEDQINAWVRDHPTFKDLHIDGTRISSPRRDLKIDLGSIGKGRVVDLAIQVLRAHGIHNAIVNAGGKLRVIGTAGHRAWRIAIRDPRDAKALGWMQIEGDESVSTSGDYERFVMIDGRRLHHLLDPRTGRPTEHTAAVTVLADDATTADGASTAVFLAGPSKWRAVARALGIRYALRVDAVGKMQITRALSQRLELLPDARQRLAIEEVD